MHNEDSNHNQHQVHTFISCALVNMKGLFSVIVARKNVNFVSFINTADVFA